MATKYDTEYGWGASKCGEITTLLSLGKKEFFLSCDLCDYKAQDLDPFIHHVCQSHIEDFIEINSKPTSSELEFLEHDEKISEQSENVVEGFENVVIDMDAEEMENSMEFKEEDISEDIIEEDNLEETFQIEDDATVLTDSTSYEEDNQEETFQIEGDATVLTDSTSYDERSNENEKGFSLNFKGLNQILTDNSSYDGQCNENDTVSSVDFEGVNNETENNIKSKEKKDFIIDFIHMYRTFPALWNTKNKDYFNRRVKAGHYKILLDKYKEMFPNAVVMDVKKKISNLRTGYNKEVKRMAKEGTETKLYYYHAISFLHEAPSDNNEELKKTNKQQIELLVNLLSSHPEIAQGFYKGSKEILNRFWRKVEEELNLAGPPIKSITELKREIPNSKIKEEIPQEDILEDSQHIILAKAYKRYTCLWNEADIAYRFTNRRNEALKSLLEEFNSTTNLNLSIKHLNFEIARLRKLCSIEKRNQIKCKRQKLNYQPTCPYYNEIDFLEADVSPFECTTCGKLLPGLGQYKVHTSSHDGSLPFVCHICGHGFQLGTNLTVHLRRHVHDYTYSCGVCSKPCATTTELKTHMRLHTGEKPFICYICGHKALTSSHLYVHMLRHKKQPRYKCKICSKMFYITGTLKEHMNSHRNIKDNLCDVCNKGFISKKQLRQHQLIHNAEKKYSCNICGKRFAQSAGLYGHIKSHGTKLSTSFKEILN